MENFLNKLINPTARTYGFEKKFPASTTLRIRTKQQPYILGNKKKLYQQKKSADVE